MSFGYGIDLAQTLNYCGIVIVEIKENVKIKTIRKLQKLTYPEIVDILFNDLFTRFPPDYICVDYTNEKSVAETIEARLHPSFHSRWSPGQWKYVRPIVFSQETKLQLKQNARELLERKIFRWPKKILSDPRIWALVDELKEQMLREAGEPGRDGLLKFPKPQGHDNDLVIAFELALLEAKKFIEEPSSRQEIPRYDPYEKYVCQECRKGNHHGRQRPPVPGPNLTTISCPCKICDTL